MQALPVLPGQTRKSGCAEVSFREAPGAILTSEGLTDMRLRDVGGPSARLLP